MNSQPQWSENESTVYIDYGHFMVPEREYIFSLFCRLLPKKEEPFSILELGCGGGELADQLLSAHPNAKYIGLDGSDTMRAETEARLKQQHAGRFATDHFQLSDPSWRERYVGVDAIVSSFVIHHLTHPEKERLYQDLYGMLNPGAVLLVADNIEPLGKEGVTALGDDWDKVVSDRSARLNGDQAPYEFFVREEWNILKHPDPMDMPAPIFSQLTWLSQAGFSAVDVYWVKAGHALFGGKK